MRKFYYHLSLAAAFFMCLFAALPPLKNRAGAALAASAAEAKPQAAAGRNSGQLERHDRPESGCRRLVFAENSFIICSADPAHDALKLFLADAQGRPYNYFRNIRTMLAERGQKPLFLMNAGMYHKDFSPVGLYVENGKQLYPAATHSGKGNFFMKPNGIFYLTAAGGRLKAGIMETAAFLKAGLKPELATQSGPMLVWQNQINPKFIRNSSFKEYRNGVGVTREGKALFAISEQKVNFYEFAQMFRSALRAPNALFLDGSISSLYAPQANRADWFYPLGPIIGVVENMDINH